MAAGLAAGLLSPKRLMIIAGASRPVVPAAMRTPPSAMRAVVPSFPVADTCGPPPPGSRRANSSEEYVHLRGAREMLFTDDGRALITGSRQEPVRFPPEWMTHRSFVPAAHRFLPPQHDHKGAARRERERSGRRSGPLTRAASPRAPGRSGAQHLGRPGSPGWRAGRRR